MLHFENFNSNTKPQGNVMHSDDSASNMNIVPQDKSAHVNVVSATRGTAKGVDVIDKPYKDESLCMMSAEVNMDHVSGPAVTTVLLATTRVIVIDICGKKCYVRMLLDSASQRNFITRACCKRLGLISGNLPVCVVKGIGGMEKFIQGIVRIKFFSRFNDMVNYEVETLVVDKVTDRLPAVSVDRSALYNLDNLPLADDSYAIPGDIDMLIGASLFPLLLLSRKVKGYVTDISPYALETVLGYVILGVTPVQVKLSSTVSCRVVDPLNNLVKKFWEMEKVNIPSTLSSDDRECEAIYAQTTTRDETVNKSMLKKLTLASNNRALAVALQQTKAELRDLNECFLQSLSERQTLMALNSKLQRQLETGLDDIDKLVNEKLQEKYNIVRTVLNDASSNLLNTVQLFDSVLDIFKREPSNRIQSLESEEDAPINFMRSIYNQSSYKQPVLPSVKQTETIENNPCIEDGTSKDLNLPENQRCKTAWNMSVIFEQSYMPEESYERGRSPIAEDEHENDEYLSRLTSSENGYKTTEFIQNQNISPLKEVSEKNDIYMTDEEIFPGDINCLQQNSEFEGRRNSLDTQASFQIQKSKKTLSLSNTKNVRRRKSEKSLPNNLKSSNSKCMTENNEEELEDILPPSEVQDVRRLTYVLPDVVNSQSPSPNGNFEINTKKQKRSVEILKENAKKEENVTRTLKNSRTTERMTQHFNETNPLLTHNISPDLMDHISRKDINNTYIQDSESEQITTKIKHGHRFSEVKTKNLLDLANLNSVNSIIDQGNEIETLDKSLVSVMPVDLIDNIPMIEAAKEDMVNSIYPLKENELSSLLPENISESELTKKNFSQVIEKNTKLSSKKNLYLKERKKISKVIKTKKSKKKIKVNDESELLLPSKSGDVAKECNAVVSLEQSFVLQTEDEINVAVECSNENLLSPPSIFINKKRRKYSKTHDLDEENNSGYCELRVSLLDCLSPEGQKDIQKECPNCILPSRNLNSPTIHSELFTDIYSNVVTNYDENVCIENKTDIEPKNNFSPVMKIIETNIKDKKNEKEPIKTISSLYNSTNLKYEIAEENSATHKLKKGKNKKLLEISDTEIKTQNCSDKENNVNCVDQININNVNDSSNNKQLIGSERYAGKKKKNEIKKKRIWNPSPTAIRLEMVRDRVQNLIEDNNENEYSHQGLFGSSCTVSLNSTTDGSSQQSRTSNVSESSCKINIEDIRPRRFKQKISYIEPRLNKKLRRGDNFFHQR